MKGRIILPSDAAFEKARRVHFWNPKTEQRPRIIAHCAHADDIARSVEFARAHNLEVAVRGGGHSPLGWGTTNGVLVDLSGLKKIDIDPAKRIGRFEAGVLGGEVASQCRRYDLAPVLGQCPGVGAAGVLLGGGLGWLSGLHGAACDNLRSARLVTADGRTLSVDAHGNPELFWALRGGGGNFGVMASFECQLVAIGPVTAGEVHYALRDARSVMQFFSGLMAEAPDSFQATLSLSTKDRSVFVSFCHSGQAAEGEQLLRTLRSVAPVIKDKVKAQNFAEFAGLPPSHDPTPPGCRYTQQLYRERLTEEVIDLTLDHLGRVPGDTVIGISHYMHGQVCRVKPEETAFPLRTAGAVHIRIGVAWEDPAPAERLMAWADAAWKGLRATSGERIYSNYQSYDGKGATEAIFGANHSRLVSLKRSYDPDNVFRRNSNVLPGRS